MKCPVCGADSTVKETRAFQAVMLRRTRACFNEHRFQTYEVHATVWAHGRHRFKEWLPTMQKKLALFRRNAAIRRELAAGVPRSVVAERMGLSTSLVHLIKHQKGAL